MKIKRPSIGFLVLSYADVDKILNNCATILNPLSGRESAKRSTYIGNCYGE